MKAPRRAFLSSLAAAPLIPAALAAGETPPVPPEASAMVEGLLAAARPLFGGSLTPSEIEGVRKGIASGLQSARRLRAHPLANGQGPVTLFEARPRTARPGSRR
jgi:hypothetical protein